MATRNLALDALIINRANDRHGELENETAAIAWLFNVREAHMRNLTKDIVEKGEIYELPLVSPEGDKFVVFDGNRRVTCLKLLKDPRRAPTAELQEFFSAQRALWKGDFPTEIACQVENDRERVDEILFRRHTGTQNGVGQSTWDDRMKSTFVARTGKSPGLSVADEIEKRLSAAGMLPARRKIPRSTMNRLLSAEPFRNRLGFSVSKGKFEFTHNEGVSLAALARVADDLATRKLVLGDIWDVDGKRHYLDGLEGEGILPSAKHAIVAGKREQVAKPAKAAKVAQPPAPRMTLIPQTDFGIAWPGRLQRQHQIWDELQFRLELAKHINAISVLFRVLVEISTDDYAREKGLTFPDKEKLANKLLKVGNDLEAKGLIDGKQLGVLKKFGQQEQLVSADTLNRYVHSHSFAPSPDHLKALWDSLCPVIVATLKA